jgi:hypothetical protein
MMNARADTSRRLARRAGSRMLRVMPKAQSERRACEVPPEEPERHLNDAGVVKSRQEPPQVLTIEPLGTSHFRSGRVPGQARQALDFSPRVEFWDP